MKKILWCGTSHLSNFYSAIQNTSFIREQLKGFESDFLLTAGKRFVQWVQEGGRLMESNGSLEYFYYLQTPNADGLLTKKSKKFILRNYDYIIFVGQWLRPLNFVNEEWFCNDQKLWSPSLRNEIIQSYILKPSHKGLFFYNDPLICFPKFKSDDAKIALIPDPLPRAFDSFSNAARGYEVMYTNYANNVEFVRDFYKQLRSWATKSDIFLLEQPDDTYSKETLTTYDMYKREDGEYTHFNDLFYKELFAQKIQPFLFGF